jgi:hypothetical protein
MPRLIWLIPAMLVGCTASKDGDTAVMSAQEDADGGDDTGTAGTVEPEPEAEPIDAALVMPTPPVFDPKLPGFESVGLSWSVGDDSDGCDAELWIDNGIGQRRTFDPADGSGNWDGRDDAGVAFDTGTATARLTVDCPDGRIGGATGAVSVIRLGIAEVDLISADDEEGNVGLAFHKQSLFENLVSPVGERPEYRQTNAGALSSNLDFDDGSPRPAVPLWADPDIPPWVDGEAERHNVPTGFIARTGMSARVQMGAAAVSEARQVAIGSWGPNANEVPQVRLVANGTPTDDLMGPGGMTTVNLEAAPSTMGRHIQTVTWEWEAQLDDGEWAAIPGGFETDHAFYILSGEPALLDGTPYGKAPPIPWIGVLENTAGIMEGVSANTNDVLTALRNHLFAHDYIVYDPGTGAYTDFEGPYMYWDNITAQLTPFLDRGAGLSLYCHSMSCMLSALAGNHGVQAEQLVLGVYFDTNYTRAAGTDSWQRWSFNSHSVVSPDDGGTIWDSSIALDGDDDPYNNPIEETMPIAMDGEEYMWRLTYDDIEIINQGLCYIE